MRLSIRFTAELALPFPTPTTLMVEAADLGAAQCLEDSRLYVAPFTVAEPFRDFYQNPCRRLLMPAGDVRLEYAATVSLPDARPAEGDEDEADEADALHLPTETLLYTLPSRYCQSDLLVPMAEDLFGAGRPGFARVQAICDWINTHLTYQYGTSDTATSAYDTATLRVGVCRDFAHLGIAFCRALNVPARYVSGYCLELDPPDFHAYFQAWVDGRWISFDPTSPIARAALVQVAAGRDAADCAWATFYGYGETKWLSVEVTETTEAEAGTKGDTDA